MNATRVPTEIVSTERLTAYLRGLRACEACVAAHLSIPDAPWCDACSTPTSYVRGMRRITPREFYVINSLNGECLSCGVTWTRPKPDFAVPLCWRCARKARRLAAVKLIATRERIAAGHAEIERLRRLPAPDPLPDEAQVAAAE